MKVPPAIQDALLKLPKLSPAGKVQPQDLQAYLESAFQPKIRFQNLEEALSSKRQPTGLALDVNTSAIRATDVTSVVTFSVDLHNLITTQVSSGETKSRQVRILGKVSVLTGYVVERFEDSVAIDSSTEKSVYLNSLALFDGMYRIEVAVEDIDSHQVGTWANVINVKALIAPRTNYGKNYKGTPYYDSRYSASPQKIPGRVECAYYDLGGEDVAYHDADAKNNGSGALNPADGTYLNQFRMNEGVDISYTKFHREIDNSRYDVVQPPENQLYVGWTEPGEWFNITVQAERAGVYTADLLYTSNRGGTISLDVNGEAATPPLNIPSTFDAKDPISWRQWHHWNLASHLAQVRLPAGKSVLTVHILTQGNMNLAYFDFK